MASLNIPGDGQPIGVRVAVWRLVQARLIADATLSASGVRLIFFDGGDDDNSDLENIQGAVMRLYPTTGPQTWFSPDALEVTLTVAVEAHLPGTDPEDVLLLQDAIEDALYPADGGAFRQSLVTAGAVTGQPTFTGPLTQPLSTAGTNRSFMPLGAFAVQIERPLNA